ncbi:zinc transporter ZIP2 [Octopus vulgaris]|uniref:Zinc transporter ZIP2 n=1 Tax=Octopus vulgaris TaxID=6645 RepID=A0AA36BH45_OCTVU|nr:zinc transporter ZIP2 [Octopus vulgaris]
MNKNYTYPFCEMLVSAGFFLVLFLERSVTILYKVWEKRSKSSDEQSNLQDGIKSPISSSSTLSSPSSPSSSPPQHQHQQPLSHQPLSSPSLPTTLATTSEVIELTTIASRNDKSENKATTEIHSSESSSRNICLHIVDEEVLPSDSKYRNTADFDCLISSRKPYKSGKTFKENQANLAESSDELCILIPDQCVCSIENHLVDSQNGRFVCQDISNKEKLFCRSHSSIGIYGSTVTDQTNIPLHFANDNSCYHNDEYHSAQNHEERTVKYISNVQTAEENTPVEETEENDDLHQSGAIILLLVLIFHSFFDGITLGLRKEVMDIFTIMFALIFHKCLIAFSLTLKLRETFTDRLWRVKLWLVIFSFISPIGATIGWLLSYNEMDPLVFHKGLSGTLTSISTALVDEFAFNGIVIRLMDGKVESGEGDALLLPANQIISKLEGVTARIVYLARDAIVPQLEKYYNIELDIGTTLITCAGSLKFKKAVNSAQNVQASEVATPILGIDKGYSPSLCAEAFVEGLLWFFDNPNTRQKTQIFNIYSKNKAALILMALAIEKRVFPFGKRTVFSDVFQIRKCRILEPTTNAVIAVVSRSAFEDIQQRANSHKTNEYTVLCNSEDSIHMIAVEQMNGRSLNEVMYVAAPESKAVDEYKYFIKVLIDQMQRTFERNQKDISVVLDFGIEVFSGDDFHRCFLSAVKYFSESLAET